MSEEHLVDVIRGNLVESTHLGHIAVVNSKGEILYYNGDPNRVTFARSSMKPLQALPIVETGAADFYNYDQADLSLSLRISQRRSAAHRPGVNYFKSVRFDVG